MSNLQIILVIYFSVSAVSLFATGLWLSENEIEGVDGFWDWLIYSLLWIVQPIKAVFKFARKQLKVENL